MKNVLLKATTSATAITLAALLSTTPIMAAEHLTVYNTDGSMAYNGEWNGEDQEQSGWTWTNEGNDLNLNGYDGGSIEADGDLTINAANENTIEGTLKVEQGDESSGKLTINGGSLNINNTSESEGIYTEDTITMKNTNVNVSSNGIGIKAYAGDVDIENSNVSITYAHDSGIITENDGGTGLTGTEIKVNHSTLVINKKDCEPRAIEVPVALLAHGAYGEENAGKITLIDSQVVLPEGYKVVHVTNHLKTAEAEMITVFASIGKNDVVTVFTSIGDENYDKTFAEHCANLKASLATDLIIKPVDKVIASNTSANSNLVQTGVMSNMSLYVTSSIAAAGVASILISFKKRK